MANLKDKTIQLYFKTQNGYSYRVSGQMTYEQFLNGGRKADNYIDTIKEIRNCEYKSEKYVALKSTLPLCSVASYSSRMKATYNDITEEYNVISIDIDLADNGEFFKEHTLDELKSSWIEHPSCFCSMLSCGGQGIVLYFLVEDLRHNADLYWKYFYLLFKKNGINIDEHAKDLMTRRRYISYDEDKFINWNATPFKLDEETRKRLNSIDQTKSSKVFRNLDIEPNEYEKGDWFDQKTDEFNNIKIDYLNNERRYKYVSTMRKIFGKAEEYKNLLYKIYNYSLDGKPHNIKDAYKDIDVHWYGKSYGIYDEIAEELKKMGIIREKMTNSISSSNVMNIELKSGEEGNQWLYDKRDEICNFFEPGMNMLVAGTGLGKTEFWNKLNEENDYRETKRNIVVVEPFNSIVEGKYDREKVHVAAGVGNRIDRNHEYNVTNYNKFVSDVNEGNMFLGTEYIVIDESHLAGMQNYRRDILVDFWSCINKILETNNYVKVILQTATESNEAHFFNIKKKVNVYKKSDKKITLFYTYNEMYIDSTDEEYCPDADSYKYNLIGTICYYFKKYKNEGRKVFVYWSAGSYSKMENIKDVLKEYGIRVVIMHNRNKDDEDMKNMLETRVLSDRFDGLISSCMFGAGCDINDEDDAAVIIVGNNPYQEDIQAIGRFRNSKDIVVNIIIRKEERDFIKVDCDKLFNLEKYKAEVINKAKDNNMNSILNRYSYNDNKGWASYITVANIYYSDIQRKFDYFKTLKNYHLFNRCETYRTEEDNHIHYSITEINYDTFLPIVRIIDDVDGIWNSIIKKKHKIKKQIKNDVYKILEEYPNTSLDEFINKYEKNASLVDWLKGLRTIQSWWNLEDYINSVDKKEVMKVSRKKMNELVKWKVKLTSNKVDNVEKDIIDYLIKKYDNKEERGAIDLYIAHCYCHWVKYNSRKEDMTYDMTQMKYGYQLYNQMKKQILSIIEVSKDTRDFILNYNVSKSNDAITDEFFNGLDNMDIRSVESINVAKNKYISQYDYNTFLNYQYTLFLNSGDKDKNKKTGGKIGGKMSSPKKKLVCKQDVIDRNGTILANEGDVFESCSDAASKIGRTIQMITLYIKKGVLEKI